MANHFHLRFESAKIKDLAIQYEFGREDVIINEVVPAIKRQGYLTLENFVTLCYWKSPRIHSRSNSSEYIEAVSQTALMTEHKQLRIEILTLLSGVRWPVASVILHWCHSEPYPILDFRALWSLGIDVQPKYNFEFW